MDIHTEMKVGLALNRMSTMSKGFQHETLHVLTYSQCTISDWNSWGLAYQREGI